MQRALTMVAVLAATVVGFGAPAAAAPGGDVPDIEWPPPGVEPPQHSATELGEFAAAMGKHLDTAFPYVVPAATELSWAEWGGEWEGIIEDGQDYLTTWAKYTDEIGQTGTMFQIEAPGHFTETPRQICAQKDTVWCKARTLKDGSLLLHKLTETPGNDRMFHIQSAFHYRTDGSLVWVAAYDYDPIWDGDEGPPRDEIALTTQQLTKLATDPALHL